jgi:lipid-A-disaccharide synthase
LKSELKIYLISGEASGDLHGGNLMKALKQENEKINFRYWGGDNMKNNGGTLVKHIKDLSFMGFLEVLFNIKKILKNLSFCKKDILEFAPDALVLIDYPGFNLRIAEWAHSKGIKVYYYISPQVWAWKKSRVFKIRRCVYKMFVILPFEREFYKNYNYSVEYVGNPLLDAIEDYKITAVKDTFYDKYELSLKPIIAILPGSRKQEIMRKLPIMLKVSDDFKEYQFIVACAPNLDDKEFDTFKNNNVRFIKDNTYGILANAEAAIVTSGTATLETALFKVPQVVCYKSSYISYFIAKQLVKIKFISLVNLIMNKEVVKELIQNECTSQKVSDELKNIVKNGNRRKLILEDYNSLIQILGGKGASKKVAQTLLKTI